MYIVQCKGTHMRFQDRAASHPPPKPNHPSILWTNERSSLAITKNGLEASSDLLLYQQLHITGSFRASYCPTKFHFPSSLTSIFYSSLTINVNFYKIILPWYGSSVLTSLLNHSSETVSSIETPTNSLNSWLWVCH